jgi:hypothetical protein
MNWFQPSEDREHFASLLFLQIQITFNNAKTSNFNILGCLIHFPLSFYHKRRTYSAWIQKTKSPTFKATNFRGSQYFLEKFVNINKNREI